MGLNFKGSPIDLGGKVITDIPTPTYSGTSSSNAADSINPYTGEGPGPAGAGQTEMEIELERNPVIGDPYWDDVVFLLQASNKALTNEPVVEDSSLGKTLWNNDVIVTTETSPIADRAFSFNGVTQYMTIDHSTDTVFATGEDYTIEFWIRNTAAGVRRACSIGDFNGENGSILTWNTNNAGVQLVPSSTVTTLWDMPAVLTSSAWHHYALTNESSTRKAWINGVMIDSAFSATAGPALGANTNYVYFGAADHHGFSNDGARHPWEPLGGYMDDIRITKGVARYTSNFDVPTEPFDAF